jgi:hypothetical protein
MRIQEHLFQGFFGNVKKEDSAKYYKKRVEKLKGLDTDLDHSIGEFEKILENHKTKIKAYEGFLKKLDKESWNNTITEINKLKGMFDEDELSNQSEKRYVMRIEDILKELTGNENSIDVKSIEQDTLNDLKELLRLIENIKPVWEEQLNFVEKNPDMSIKENIHVLTEIFKHEDNLLKMEENLLKKIDLKTGNILRKTTLKLRDLEKTNDMNMNYRQIKHIR